MAHPFGTPELAVEDTVRLLVVAGCVAMLFVYIAIGVNRQHRRFTRATFPGLVAQFAAAVYISGTEWTRLGHSIFEGHFWWRLPTAVMCVAFMLATAVRVTQYPPDPFGRHSEYGRPL